MATIEYLPLGRSGAAAAAQAPAPAEGAFQVRPTAAYRAAGSTAGAARAASAAARKGPAQGNTLGRSLRSTANSALLAEHHLGEAQPALPRPASDATPLSMHARPSLTALARPQPASRSLCAR